MSCLNSTWLHTPEIRKKISLALTGKKLSQEHRKKLSDSHKGYIMPESQKIKISLANKGERSYRWKGGKSICIDCGKQLGTRKAIRCVRHSNKLRRDGKHHNWKYGNASYRSLHIWVTTRLGKPDICEFCKKQNLKGRQIHWANKSGKYLWIITDWLRLCSKCHKQYDKKCLKSA